VTNDRTSRPVNHEVAARLIYEGPLGGADPKVEARLATIERKLDALLARDPQPAKLLLTFTESAARLGVSRRQLFEWRAAGLIATVQVGTGEWISADTLEKFVQSHESKGPK
jgi:hypothetical protein